MIPTVAGAPVPVDLSLPVEATPSAPMTDITEVMLRAAVQIARAVEARHLFVYAHALADMSVLARVETDGLSLVLVSQGDKLSQVSAGPLLQVLALPNVDLDRMGQVRTAGLLAYGEGLVEAGETFVCLTGPAGAAADALVIQKAGTDRDAILHPIPHARRHSSQAGLPAPAKSLSSTAKLHRLVFARTLSLCLTFAAQGREGKPIGTTLVLGDHRNTLRYARQTILNPFRGYPETRRNILDVKMEETLRGFAGLDGAFLLKANGVVITAGAYLTGFPRLDTPNTIDRQTGTHPPGDMRGLGTRHHSAAALTAFTEALAFVISESSGTVRVYRAGRLIAEIERAGGVRLR